MCYSVQSPQQLVQTLSEGQRRTLVCQGHIWNRTWQAACGILRISTGNKRTILQVCLLLTAEAECDRPAGSALDRAVPLVELYVERKALFARDKEALAPWGLVQRAE